jgi:integrase/recombinase XerD
MDISKISSHNMRIFDKYIDKNASNGISDATIDGQKMTILPFLNWCDDKDVELLSEDDIYGYMRHLRDFRFLKNGKLVCYAQSTMYTTRSFIKKFLSTINPTVAATIKNQRSKKRKLPEDILTEEEIEKLIAACQSARDRALISTLYESGARKGELLAVKIKHIEFDNFGAVITFPTGKTGARRNRLIFASSYLKEWISVHPLKSDRDAYLFCSLRNPYNVISHSGIENQLNDLATRAGITKHIYPHLFRHSKATHLTKE